MTYLVPQNTWFGSSSNIDQNNQPFTAMRKALDQVFHEFGGVSSGNCSHCTSLRLNISETDNAAEIDAELPGVEEKDVEVSLNDDVLTIRGEKRMEREDQQKNYRHQERMFGKFERSIELSFKPDPKAVKALFAKGILKITLPKSASAVQNNVKIPIKTIA
jgi:HSP20 family protein